MKTFLFISLTILCVLKPAMAQFELYKLSDFEARFGKNYKEKLKYNSNGAPLFEEFHFLGDTKEVYLLKQNLDKVELKINAKDAHFQFYLVLNPDGSPRFGMYYFYRLERSKDTTKIDSKIEPFELGQEDEVKLKSGLNAFVNSFPKYHRSLNGRVFSLGFEYKETKAKLEVWEQLKRTTRPDTVKGVDLSNLQLTSLPTELKHFKHLESLDLSGNKLTKIPGYLWKMKQLEYLHLEYNRLTNNGLNIKRNKRLDYLNLQFNAINHFPKKMRALPKLRHILLGNNFLQATGNQRLPKHKSIQLLNLYNADIAVFPNGLTRFKNLKELDLYHNQIEQLPESIKRLTRLEILAVSYNKLLKFPESIQTMNNLKMLYAHHNKLGRLIAFPSNLEHLDVGYNGLAELPKSLAEAKGLKVLDISYNELTEIPEWLRNLPDLNEFFQRGNPFVSETDSGIYRKFVEDLEAKSVTVK